MKIKAVILIFFFLFSAAGASIRAQTQEYGEDSKALGQFVDDFENLDNVSVRVQVERNITLAAMELNFSSGLAQYEDFTTYIETDPSNRIIVNSATLFTWTRLDRSDGITHLQKDYGINYFGQDFVYSWIFEVTGLNGGDGDSRDCGYSLCFTNNAGNPLVDPRITLLVQQAGGSDVTYYLYFRIDDPHAGWDFDITILLDVGTTYYIKLERVSGDDLTLEIRTGSFEGVVTDTLTVHLASFDDNFRYILPIYSKSSATDPNDWYSGTFEFLWNQSGGSGYATDGYFTTVDYLSDPLANGSILVQMTSATIPANTEITVQFSDDNSIWVNNEGAAGYNTLTDGFLSIDLRELNWSAVYHLRYNLSTSDPAVTPRLNQSRLITTIGNASIITESQNITGEWIEYNLTQIGVLVGTLDDGNLNSTLDIDGDTYNVSETVGTPAWTISFNWTGIPDSASCIWVEIYYHYDGNLRHDVDVEIWNFTSSSWVFLGHIVDGVDFVWLNVSIYDLRIPNDFVNSSGAVLGRMNHPDPGNINHDLFIEYLKLIAFVPSDVAVMIEEPFQFFWIVLAIALAMIILIIAKIWFEEGDP